MRLAAKLIRLSPVVRRITSDNIRKTSGSRNEVGIEVLQENLSDKLYPPSDKLMLYDANPDDVAKVKRHLDEFELPYHIQNTESSMNNLAMNKLFIPPLTGENLCDHFWNIATCQVSPYVKYMNTMVVEDNPPSPPPRWKFESGWTKYRVTGTEETCSSIPVPYPDEDCLFFDVEVLTAANMPLIATALSPTSWYSWCSPHMLTGKIPSYARNDDKTLHADDLIRMESDNAAARARRPRMIVGHSVSFDRSYIREQYYDCFQTGHQASALKFMDTLSLHMSCSGLKAGQRRSGKYNSGKVRELDIASLDSSSSEALKIWLDSMPEDVGDTETEDRWMKESSLNNLADILALYRPELPALSKEARSSFICKDARQVSQYLANIIQNFQELCTYCSRDVIATKQVFQRLYPLFLERCPHPATLSGILEMSTMVLPVNKAKWNKYLMRSQEVYDDLTSDITKLLTRVANESLSYINVHSTDPWLWTLNWETQHLSLNKGKANKCHKSDQLFFNERNITIVDEFFDEPVTTSEIGACEVVRKVLATSARLPKRPPHKPGYPKWYRDLCSRDGQNDLHKLTCKTRCTSLLLRLSWKGHPVYHNPKLGWGYITEKLKSAEGSHEIDNETVQYMHMAGDQGPFEIQNASFAYYRIPHPANKPDANVGNLLSKPFHTFAESGTMVSCLSTVVLPQLIKYATMISYWENNMDRIRSQMVISIDEKSEWGAIIPRTVVCGTISRRAVERTWLTASNAQPHIVGSELKSMIQLPSDRFCFVGADVDSQEMWIAALFGDGQRRMHGSSACSWMLINGERSQGTDLHSRIAAIVGVSRDHAKVLNYARIYGAGKQYATKLLHSFNPSLSEKDAQQKIDKMYRSTKGTCTGTKNNNDPTLGTNNEAFSSGRWQGGSESDIFNSLEAVALSEKPRTPVLGARMTRALEPRNVGNDFMTTRINWVVQSSAVDFLHLLLTCMKWLDTCEEKPKGHGTSSATSRLALTIHDELRFIAPTSDRYRTAMKLQISNLLTRALFAHQTMKSVNRDGRTCLPRYVAPPASVAFFSSVEIDNCLRKKPDDECISPSNPLGLKQGYGIEHGESLDIHQLMEKTKT